MNKNSSLTWHKTEEQNSRAKGISFGGDKNDISIKDNTRTNAFSNRVVTTTTTNNINTGNITNNNINNFSNQFGTTSQSLFPGQTKIYSTQSEYSVSNMNNLGGNILTSTQPQVQNIITKTTTTNTNISNNVTSFTPGYESTTSTGMFGGKLIEVLSNEIGKKESEYQTEQGQTKEIDTGAIFGNNNEIMKTVTSSIQHETHVISGNRGKGGFIIMYPVYNTNHILGALKDESSGNIEVDFENAFGEKDIPLRAFPQGAAFCNFEKYLYVTGGQEKLKGVSKLFLRVTINIEKESKARMVKMPSMLFSHWNHSMISNENYIFVIGGFNSNKCEAFNLRTLKWEAMPDLNSPERQSPILTIHDDYLYAFMGHTQYNILDTVERINIKNLGSNKWENVIVSNPNNVNTRFYGAGVYYVKDDLYFIGGKNGLGNGDTDYKSEIYCYHFDKNEFLNTDICYKGNLVFVENKFHHVSEENVGNFIDVDNGVLATMPISSIMQVNN